MAVLNVQIQPGRLASFEEGAVDQLCAARSYAGLIQDVSKSEGYDQRRYINIFFTTVDPKRFWPVLREQLILLGLQAACIVTCTGRDGWNDYLLLHHFDPQYRAGEARAL